MTSTLRPVHLFKDAAAALLLALATALFLINLTRPVDWVSPADPVFALPLPTLFWIMGGGALLAALICLFVRNIKLSLYLLAWLAMNGLVYLTGAYFQNWHGLTGLLNDFSRAFHLSPSFVNALLYPLAGGLLAGSVGSLLWLWRLEKKTKGQIKTICPACGGHVQFAPQNAGQQIPCPHCRKPMTLRLADQLKMTCFFCHEHIAFPAHALGQKLPCPHCHRDITLKEM